VLIFCYYGQTFAPLYSCSFLIPLYIFGFEATELTWELLLPIQATMSRYMLPTLAPLSTYLSRSVVYKSHLAYIWFLSKIYLWSQYIRFLSSAVPIGFTIRHQCLILEIVDRVILVHLSPFQRNYVASYPMLRLWFWLAAHHHWWPHLFLCLITIFTEILRYIFSVYDEFVFTCLVRFCNLQNLHTCFTPHAAAGILLVGVSGCAQRIKP